MHESDKALRGHLKLSGATALAITIVVGSGALVLPGIAFHAAGASAVGAWIIAAAITVPLLFIFADLGSRFPGAGGVAGFVREAFGSSPACGVEVVLLGTFGLGIPAIALTGAGYLKSSPILAVIPSAVVAGCLIVFAAAICWIGASVSARFQLVLAVILTVTLLGVGLWGAITSAVEKNTNSFSPQLSLLTVGVVFFAFTGWELVTFTTEEYENPQRDFPRVIAISFIVVTAMYLLLAIAVDRNLDQHGEETVTAPITALIAPWGPSAVAMVTVIALIVIAANLVGAVWASSRLVMASAREGLLPGALSKITHNVPRRAVLVVAVAFLAVLAADGAGIIDMPTMLTYAGKNFFILYLVCVACSVRLTHGTRKVFGVIVLVIMSGVAISTFGASQLLYVFTLFIIGWILSIARTGKHSKSSSAVKTGCGTKEK